MNWITIFNNTLSNGLLLFEIALIVQNFQYIKNTVFNLAGFLLLNYTIVEKNTKKIYNSSYFTGIRTIINNWKRPNEIQIIKNSNVKSVSLNTFYLTDKNDIIFDLIIYSNYKHSSTNIEPYKKQIDTLVYYNDNIDLMYNQHKTYFNCNYTFISLTIKIEGKGEFSIKLLDSTYNYYIVGNKINCLLISHLLKTQHNINILDSNMLKYEIELIDNNVTVLKLNEHDEILLNSNNYVIQQIKN